MRQIRSHLFFKTIQVISLVIGFSVFLTLLSLSMKDLGYDQSWNTGDRLCRVSMEQYQDGQLSFRSAKSYRGIPGMMNEEFPEVTAMTRLMPDVITVFVGEQQIQDVRMFYADSNLFKVLPREILARESEELFPDIHSMAISASLARKLYGSIDCLGKELRLNEGWIFYISTVFEDIPAKSHLHFDVLMSRASLIYYMRNFDNTTGQLVDNEEFTYVDPGPYHRSSWSNSRSYNYILVREGTDMGLLQKKTMELIGSVNLPDRLKSTKIIPDIQPLEKIHLHSDYPDEIKENSSLFQVYMLLLIGTVVLLISWINFINLYAVVFIERIRMIAIRMIHGAGHRRITQDIFKQAFALGLLGATLSAVAMMLSAHFSPEFEFAPGLLILLLLLGCITALFSVLISVSTYNPGRIMGHLKGELMVKRRGSGYRRIMVVIQFISGVVLIACTMVISLQMNFTRKKELGFDDKNIVYSFSPMTMNQRPDIPQKLELFRNEMAALPGVNAFCVSSSVPGRPIHFSGFDMSSSSDGQESEAFIEPVNVDAYYFDLYGILLLGGRGFRENENYEVNEAILNRKAAEELGFEVPVEALGQVIRSGGNTWEIVGVVENYHHFSLKDKLIPLVFFKSLRWRAAVGYYSFRLNPGSQETLAHIDEIWSKVYPGERFLHAFMDESFREQYKSDSSMASSFLIAALLALAASCLGLLGLSRYNILKRTKEIGIRKAFGSSSYLVLRLLQRETLVMVLLASFIGIPLSWRISRSWLDHFSFRIDLAWWIFVLASLMVLLVAILTTIVQTYRASRKNPVDALQFE
ncbi:MAG: FtsX-like permease family protein [Bacteroidetes bacterium]|nr:FtsX-like permease family protein [Bacteroidota bacterium]